MSLKRDRDEINEGGEQNYKRSRREEEHTKEGCSAEGGRMGRNCKTLRPKGKVETLRTEARRRRLLAKQSEGVIEKEKETISQGSGGYPNTATRPQ